MGKLTIKEERCVLAYMELGNKTRAYRRAYDCSRMKDSTVNYTAWHFFEKDKIATRVEELKHQLAAPIIADRQKILQALTDIALADATELSGVQVRGCRHCWGINHEYQWANPMEFAYRLADVMDSNNAAEKQWLRAGGDDKLKPEPTPLPSDRGGYGFELERGPNPECPRCLGEGHEVVKITDTRKLKGAARRLYAGVKQTKDGIEIKTRDQDKALDTLQKHFKITDSEISNNIAITHNTNAVNIEAVVVPNDPAEASSIYRQLIQGPK